jgi:hypothetical protein
MGFLSKTNPKATPASVLFAALKLAAVMAVLWAVCLWLRPNPNWKPSWPFFWLWLCCAFFVGAVREWQVADED